MSEKQSLAERMREFLHTGTYKHGAITRQIRLNESQRATLRYHCVELESITAETPARTLLGRWARARRYWHEITGEQLI